MSTGSNVTLRDLMEALNNLENKMGARMDKQDAKIDTIEAFQNRVLGMAGVLSAFVGGLAAFLWDKITAK